MITREVWACESMLSFHVVVAKALKLEFTTTDENFQHKTIITQNDCAISILRWAGKFSIKDFYRNSFCFMHAKEKLLKVHFWDVFPSSRSHRLSRIIRVRWALDGALSIIHSMEYLTRVELTDHLETLIKHENETRPLACYSRLDSPVVNFYSSTRYFLQSTPLARFCEYKRGQLVDCFLHAAIDDVERVISCLQAFCHIACSENF